MKYVFLCSVLTIKNKTKWKYKFHKKHSKRYGLDKFDTTQLKRIDQAFATVGRLPLLLTSRSLAALHKCIRLSYFVFFFCLRLPVLLQRAEWKMCLKTQIYIKKLCRFSSSRESCSSLNPFRAPSYHPLSYHTMSHETESAKIRRLINSGTGTFHLFYLSSCEITPLFLLLFAYFLFFRLLRTFLQAFSA